MKIKIENISNLLESNNFLRALWAELRNRFGKCAWYYQPFKDGAKQTIFLGQMDINQEQTIPVSLAYSKKSIISEIHFGEQFDEPLNQNSELGQQLKEAVDKAYQCRNNPITRVLQIPISSLYSSLAPYSGQWFEILPDQHPISLLKLKIRAFDNVDATSEFVRISSHILDILSVETNSILWLSGTLKYSQLGEYYIKSKGTDFPRLNTFVSDEKWMDDTQYYNGYQLISSQSIQFFDRILSKDELTFEEEVFIRSCHHFHVAREQDTLINNRVVITGEQKDEDGGITLFSQEDPRFESASRFSRRAEEIATVLYMSAIEVASTIDSEPSAKCNTCGQEQYKISARVIDYTKKYLGLEDDHPLVKTFKFHYKKRSKFLHAGIALRDHSYSGITIPKLDPSSESGVSQRTSVLLINLREWIGYMLRQQLKSL